MEYFYWCEDMNLAPVLGVWAGFSLESGGNTPITGNALQPYIDDVLNELEVCFLLSGVDMSLTELVCTG